MQWSLKRMCVSFAPMEQKHHWLPQSRCIRISKFMKFGDAAITITLIITTFKLLEILVIRKFIFTSHSEIAIILGNRKSIRAINWAISAYELPGQHSFSLNSSTADLYRIKCANSAWNPITREP